MMLKNRRIYATGKLTWTLYPLPTRSHSSSFLYVEWEECGWPVISLYLVSKHLGLIGLMTVMKYLLYLLSTFLQTENKAVIVRFASYLASRHWLQLLLLDFIKGAYAYLVLLIQNLKLCCYCYCVSIKKWAIGYDSSLTHFFHPGTQSGIQGMAICLGIKIWDSSRIPF